MSYEFQNNSGQAVARTELGAGIEVDRIADSSNSATNAVPLNTDVLRGRTRALDGTAEAFILSTSEANGYFTNNADRQTQLATNTSQNADWWLRSPGANTHEAILLRHVAVRVYNPFVVSLGNATIESPNWGIRPALWIRR